MGKMVESMISPPPLDYTKEEIGCAKDEWSMSKHAPLDKFWKLFKYFPKMTAGFWV